MADEKIKESENTFERTEEKQTTEIAIIDERTIRDKIYCS